MTATPSSSPDDPLVTALDFRITPQPDEETCGPACLHAVYGYYRRPMAFDELVSDIRFLPTGGTLAVFLALHALRRGFSATIYTCNLQLFDPTWFTPGSTPGTPAPGSAPSSTPGPDNARLRERLIAQAKVKDDPVIQQATDAYVAFLDLGGRLLMEDVTLDLLAAHLRMGMPIIAGLSATWLYQAMRERPGDWAEDDVAGVPFGHFVVLRGVDVAARQVRVSDPYLNHPYPGSHDYTVGADRAIASILLGIVTYDAKLLMISPEKNV